jgi:hypothetical protein
MVVFSLIFVTKTGICGLQFDLLTFFQRAHCLVTFDRLNGPKRSLPAIVSETQVQERNARQTVSMQLPGGAAASSIGRDGRQPRQVAHQSMVI